MSNSQQLNIFQNSTIDDCELVSLEPLSNGGLYSGTLVSEANCPFKIKRIYYLFNVPENAVRGGHAHHELYQLLIAVSGSYTVVLNDGKNEKRITLNNPNTALKIIPGIWRELDLFSTNSVCLVLASNEYSSDDYIRDFTTFQKLKSN